MSKSTLLSLPNKPHSDIKVMLMNYITKKDVKIPQYSIEILKILIKCSSNEFDTISVSLQKIIDDNRIDFKDVPEFILLIENLYILIVRHRKKLAPYSGNALAVTAGEILKIIITLLVEMEYFSLSNFISIDIDDDDHDDNTKNNDTDENIDSKQHEKNKLISHSSKIIDVCVKLLLIPINNECKIARKVFGCCC